MEFFNDVGSSPLRPSLFELVAQEQLRDLLQPALKYVLSVSLASSFVQLIRLIQLVLGSIGVCTALSEISLADCQST
jgi:hypothetical protein